MVRDDSRRTCPGCRRRDGHHHGYRRGDRGRRCHAHLRVVAAGIVYPFFGVRLSPIIAAAMARSWLSVAGNTNRLRRYHPAPLPTFGDPHAEPEVDNQPARTWRMRPPVASCRHRVEAASGLSRHRVEAAGTSFGGSSRQVISWRP